MNNSKMVGSRWAWAVVSQRNPSPSQCPKFVTSPPTQWEWMGPSFPHWKSNAHPLQENDNFLVPFRCQIMFTTLQNGNVGSSTLTAIALTVNCIGVQIITLWSWNPANSQVCSVKENDGSCNASSPAMSQKVQSVPEASWSEFCMGNATIQCLPRTYHTWRWCKTAC